MYVVVVHDSKDPELAFDCGETLVKNEGAPAGARGPHAHPALDKSVVTCPFE